MHCSTFRNVTNGVLCWNNFGGDGTICPVVFVGWHYWNMHCSASVAVCSGPGEEMLCNEKIFLPQSPYPYFKLLEVTVGSRLGWGENFKSDLRL